MAIREGHFPASEGHFPVSETSFPAIPASFPASLGHFPTTLAHSPASQGYFAASRAQFPASLSHVPAFRGHIPASRGHVAASRAHVPASLRHVAACKGGWRQGRLRHKILYILAESKKTHLDSKRSKGTLPRPRSGERLFSDPSHQSENARSPVRPLRPRSKNGRSPKGAGWKKAILREWKGAGRKKVISHHGADERPGEGRRACGGRRAEAGQPPAALVGFGPRAPRMSPAPVSGRSPAPR